MDFTHLAERFSNSPATALPLLFVAGVLTSFQTLLLEGKKASSIASEEASEGLLKQQVENDPNSIGFVSHYQAGLGGVNVVGYNGVACNPANAVSGQYAGVARFYDGLLDGIVSDDLEAECLVRVRPRGCLAKGCVVCDTGGAQK